MSNAFVLRHREHKVRLQIKSYGIICFQILDVKTRPIRKVTKQIWTWSKKKWLPYIGLGTLTTMVWRSDRKSVCWWEAIWLICRGEGSRFKIIGGASPMESSLPKTTRVHAREELWQLGPSQDEVFFRHHCYPFQVRSLKTKKTIKGQFSQNPSIGEKKLGIKNCQIFGQKQTCLNFVDSFPHHLMSAAAGFTQTEFVWGSWMSVVRGCRYEDWSICNFAGWSVWLQKIDTSSCNCSNPLSQSISCPLKAFLREYVKTLDLFQACGGADILLS